MKNLKINSNYSATATLAYMQGVCWSKVKRQTRNTAYKRSSHDDNQHTDGEMGLFIYYFLTL